MCRVHSSSRFRVRTWIAVLALAVALVAGCGGEESAEAPNDGLALPNTPDTMTIHRVLQTDDRFSTLVAALDSTGLDSTLASDGPYTLFAPPNSAFDRLPEGTMAVLLTERVGRLRAILAQHVVEGHVRAADLGDASVLTTLRGDTLRVRRDSALTVGPATIVGGDVPVTNGRIHVLDRVLPPPSED